jgi:hypothetical protein
MSPDPPRRPVPRIILIGLSLLALGIVIVSLAWAWQSSSLAQSRTETLTPAPIDGDRAYKYLKQLCALGPRPAGSEVNNRQRRLVADHFRSLGAEVTEQSFNARDPLTGRPLTMANLVGSWFPDRTLRIVIGAHYDTRPFPDEELDPTARRGVFLGANDGASGVALLMEIAHHLKDLKTPYGVDLVLFDGEELVYDQVGEYFLGSKEFARRYRASVRDRSQRQRYVAGLVLDMVGDADLNIAREVNSLRLAPQVVREVWDVAQRLQARGFLSQRGPEVLDDHLPLNEAGIPTADLIDFDYPHWHMTTDTPERCSPASLAQVGRVVTAWLCLPGKERRR